MKRHPERRDEMAEEKQSWLYKLKPIIGKMPTIKKPEGHVHFKTKMSWTLATLLLYFALTNVMIYGLLSLLSADISENKCRAVMVEVTFLIL